MSWEFKFRFICTSPHPSFLGTQEECPGWITWVTPEALRTQTDRVGLVEETVAILMWGQGEKAGLVCLVKMGLDDIILPNIALISALKHWEKAVNSN